ncbi:MAG: hypothetical protein R2854_16970 [Caldilineaceae bacterium]
MAPSASNHRAITTATTLLAVTPLADAQSPLLERYYAVVASFATVRDDVAWNEVQLRWPAWPMRRSSLPTPLPSC